MTIINKRGKERVRKLKSYSMEVGNDEKTLMFFEYPGDVKGTGFLTWNYDEIGKDDDKWLYLPAMKSQERLFYGHRFYLRRYGRPQYRRRYPQIIGRGNRERTQMLESGIYFQR